MGAVAGTLRRALDRFRVVRIMTIAELMLLLDCSVRTAHRRLKGWGALNSCNGNGRYYAVPEVVQFDADGLWRCRGALFSRYGNLTDTVAALVAASASGLTAAELGRKLGMNAHSFISRYAAHPLLRRERIGGRHVYFGSDPAVRQRQLRSRRAAGNPAACELPSDAEAVLIFAEMLRQPQLEPQELARRLAAQGTHLDATRIAALLAHHGLEKKRTPASGSCLP